MLVQALHIGEKIEIRKLQKSLLFNPALKDPYIIKFENDKYLVVFKYGVVVFFGLEQDEVDQALFKIRDYVDYPFETPDKEEMELKIGAEKDDIETDYICITELTVHRIAIVSEVLSRSVALEHFEIEVEEVLKEFGDITNKIAKGENVKLSNKVLLKKVGFGMNIQHQIISRLTMLDKPDLTWDSADLDQFYREMSEEYEIEERYATLSKKLEIIFRDVEFIMNFLDTRRGFFMELIIIILIAIEIVLFIYDLFI